MRNNRALCLRLLIHGFFSLLFTLAVYTQSAQPTEIKVDANALAQKIKIEEDQKFAVQLEAGRKYAIVVDQKGIDVVVRLMDAGGKLVKEQDGTNGNNGPETIYIEPEAAGSFTVSVKPLVKKSNPPAGDYTVRVARVSGEFITLRLPALQEDFDLMVSALKEAHTGLNWYSTYKEYDDFCAAQRKTPHDQMTVLEFLRVLAPVVAFAKEGHTAIRLSAEDTAFIDAFGRYFPFQIKFLNRQPYVINDFDNIKSRGMRLTRINGRPVDEIVKALLNIEPDDGFIVSGKYHWIEENGNFPRYLIRFVGESRSFSVELADPKTGTVRTYDNVRAVRSSECRRLWREATPKSEYDFPAAKLEFQDEIKTAILTYNTFDTLFQNEKFDFEGFTDKAFDQLKQHRTEHLIIDIRKNDGGEEGLEDYVFAYLHNKPYTKYRYVQSSGPTYSFLNYTNFNTRERQDRFAATLKSEHYLSSDGRWLRKKEILPPAAPRADAYAGDIYVITGGLTYSGGSEFASIIKGNRPNSTFIGEETGGGYYGNTSGIDIRLTLPNSKIWVRIPILKFVVEVGGDIPFGRGVIPDDPIEPTIEEYLSGVDPVMNHAIKLIREKK